MAYITRFPFVHHLRSDPSRHVLHFSGGRLRRSGRGLAYWFRPLPSAIAELPVDDRELPFLFHARSQDYQDVTVQGVVTWRVSDPQALAERVDFSIDPANGRWREQPLEQIAAVLSGLAQQCAWAWVAERPVRRVLERGADELRARIREVLVEQPELPRMGLEVVAVAISGVSPTAELEKALQTPALESIQEAADQALFQRRALAVEKERAIQENELDNRIELARRESELISRHGENARRSAEEEAAASRIASEAAAERRRVEAAAEAQAIEQLEGARVAAERERMQIYDDLEPRVMLGLAAREFAGKLERIEHLNLGPDLFGSLLTDLVGAGARHLNAGAQEREAP